jgi:hypothetical protein
VLLLLTGVFIGIALATYIVQKVVQRHMKVLWLNEEVKKYRIVDFYGHEVLYPSSMNPFLDLLLCLPLQTA